MGGKLVLDGAGALPFDAATDLVGGAERLVHIEALKPDICSLDCGSFNNGLDNEVYVSIAGMVREMAGLIPIPRPWEADPACAASWRRRTARPSAGRARTGRRPVP
jgi:uncharacterized protein (DUF849 family)